MWRPPRLASIGREASRTCGLADAPASSRGRTSPVDDVLRSTGTFSLSLPNSTARGAPMQPISALIPQEQPPPLASQPYAHIQLGAHDVSQLTAFYDQVLGVLGWVRGVDLRLVGAAGVFWRRPGCRWPQFVVREPFDGCPATVGNGTQVSFLAESRSMVHRAWRVALEAGGSDEGRPGLRPRYAPDFFAAYCRDPEGHKLCFVCTVDP